MAQPVASNVDKLVGKRIQKKRRELGYTAERLSEYVDISQPQLSRYETGVNKINLSHLVAIATFLKTPISYFFVDCMQESEWNNASLDRHWQELTQSQKQHFVAFLQELREENKK
ncbi:helix-turn-helix domain-containing protein [Avibacterium avium]|uniref:helix-turn-helix domain-containing protein n=1 Tax=Avibacterium avium TaxID=751 RepID=UPI003BF8F378